MKKVVFNALTGEITIEEIEIEELEVNIEDIKRYKTNQIIQDYASKKNEGFTSSVTGEEVKYRYDNVDQLNYSKWANVLALNPLKNAVSFETDSHGFITLTREQFIALIDDIEKFEMNLYIKRRSIEEKIKTTNDIDELNKIDISL